MKTDLGNPMLGLDTPPPPEELRGRALAAAAAALGREPKVELWSRLWFSRPLRLAWIVIVLASVACHAWLTVERRPAPGGDTAIVVDASTVGDAELEEIVNLPPIDRRLLADAGLMVDRNDTGHRKEGS